MKSLPLLPIERGPTDRRACGGLQGNLIHAPSRSVGRAIRPAAAAGQCSVARVSFSFLPPSARPRGLHSEGAARLSNCIDRPSGRERSTGSSTSCTFPDDDSRYLTRTLESTQNNCIGRDRMDIYLDTHVKETEGDENLLQFPRLLAIETANSSNDLKSAFNAFRNSFAACSLRSDS